MLIQTLEKGVGQMDIELYFDLRYKDVFYTIFREFSFIKIRHCFHEIKHIFVAFLNRR